MTFRGRLARLRTGRRAEPVAVVAFVLAFGLGTVHWVGLAVGGALVGLLAPTFRRALVMGLYLGGTVALAFLAWLSLSGALWKAVDAPQLLGPSLVAALIVPTLGAGLRGLG